MSATGASYANNAVLVKYDPEGHALWARTVSSGQSSSYFHGVVSDGAAGVCAAGSQHGTGEYAYGAEAGIAGVSVYNNVVLVSYDSSGTAYRARSVTAGSNETTFNTVTADGAGGIYAAGFQTGTGRYTYGQRVSAAGSSVLLSAVLVRYER